MRARYAIALAILGLVGATATAQAWFPHGTVAPVVGPCPFADDNGCSGANQSSYFMDANFFTTARQSGQSQYKDANGVASDYPLNRNQAGINFPVGHYTPTASLTDLKTNVPSGCSISGSQITCNQTAGIVLEHYRIKGVSVGIGQTGVTVRDSYITVTADNCRNNTGGGIIWTHDAGHFNDPALFEFNTWDFDFDCAMNANAWGTPASGDLVKNSDFTGTYAASSVLNGGGLLTVGTGTTGKMYPFAFVDFTGKAHAATSDETSLRLRASWIGTGNIVPLAANTSTFTVESTDAGSPSASPSVGDQIICASNISGCPADTGTYTITALQSAGVYTIGSGGKTVASGTAIASGTASTPCSASACDGSKWIVNTAQTATSVASTTGPVLSSANGNIAISGNGKIEAYYNANLGGYGQFIGTGVSTSPIIAKYNFEMVRSVVGQHVNFIFNGGSGGTMSEFTQDGNTIYWDQYAESGGTGTLDLFTTSTAGATNAMQITDNFNARKNVLIANNSIYNTLYGTGSSHTYNTNSLIRFLSQGGGAPGHVASKISYDLNSVPGSGILNVTAITLVTAGVGLSPDDFIYCGGSAPTCSVPIRIIAQLTGTGGASCPDATCDGTLGTYSVTNTVNSFSKVYTVAGSDKYPGQINTLDWSDNAVDATGTQGSPFNGDWAGVPIGTTNYSGTFNLKSGSACTPAGCP